MRPRVAQAVADLDLPVPEGFTMEDVRKQAAVQSHGAGTGWWNSEPDPGYCLFGTCNGRHYQQIDKHMEECMADIIQVKGYIY